MVWEWLVGVFDVFLSPLMMFQPHIALMIISAAITLAVTIVGAAFTNKEAVKGIKDRMEAVRENLVKAQKDKNMESVNKFLNELVKINNEYMKQMMKSMFVSLIFITAFIPWLRYKYESMTVAVLPFELPVIGSSLDWLLWYILVSFAVGWVVRKLLGLG